MGSIDLSVIICTLNRSELLGKCLESIVQQDSGAFGFETIVVDNGSTDDTKVIAESFRCRLKDLHYVHEPRKGLARARQTGFEASVGRYVAYLDDDAMADPHWCLAICEAFECAEGSSISSVAALGGPIEPLFETARPSWLAGELTAVYAIVDMGDELQTFPGAGCPIGANMAFPRNALLENPWNDRLLMCEEVELFARLARLGFTFLYVPEMRVRHFIPVERLTPAWVAARYMAEGLAVARLPLGFRRKARLTISGIAKLLPLCALALFRSGARSLVFRCKLRFYYGFLAGLLGFGDLWRTKYLSVKRKAASYGSPW